MNLRKFNPSKFAKKMRNRGKDCLTVKKEITSKKFYLDKDGNKVYPTWWKETVYRKVAKNHKQVYFLEYVGTPLGTWFKVTNEDTIIELQNEFA